VGGLEWVAHDEQEVERRRRQSGGQGESSAPAAGKGRAEHVLGEEEERGESGGLVWNFQGFLGPLGKERFPTDLEV
jgi:hypothetical protein